MLATGFAPMSDPFEAHLPPAVDGPSDAAPSGGDPTADDLATDLAQRFRERLRIFAARRLADASEAEDVAQETLRRAVEALRAGRVENLAALPAFLFQTATHVCLHRSRSAGRESRALRGLAEVSAAGGELAEGDALDGLVREERRAEVRAAVDRLPAADREVLRLAFDDGLDAAEIGRRLGTSPGAIRVRKHRALHRLAEMLGGRNEAAGAGT